MCQNCQLIGREEHLVSVKAAKDLTLEKGSLFWKSMVRKKLTVSSVEKENVKIPIWAMDLGLIVQHTTCTTNCGGAGLPRGEGNEKSANLISKISFLMKLRKK